MGNRWAKASVGGGAGEERGEGHSGARPATRGRCPEAGFGVLSVPLAHTMYACVCVKIYKT